MRGGNIQLIVLNPILEILVKIVNLFLPDFKVNALCKQLNKFHKMFVIVFIQEVTLKKHRCKADDVPSISEIT